MKTDVLRSGYLLNLRDLSQEFYVVFVSGVEVTINVDQRTWEKIEKNDNDTYLSGGFVVEDRVIIDYDGCFELPIEVKTALLMMGFKLDLD